MTKAEKVRALAQFVDNDREVAATLRAYADLLEEREREERLLRDGWQLNMVDEKFAWLHMVPYGSAASNPDRATAAKLAEEKMR